MIHEHRNAVPQTPTALQAEYETALARRLDETGVARAAAETGIDRDRLEALAAGDPPTLTVEEALSIQALDPDAPGPEIAMAEARDHLLVGMATAVLDVDTLAGAIQSNVGPNELQQKIEGRAPLTLGEYARIQHEIVRRIG